MFNDLGGLVFPITFRLEHISRVFSSFTFKAILIDPQIALNLCQKFDVQKDNIIVIIMKGPPLFRLL